MFDYSRLHWAAFFTAAFAMFKWVISVEEQLVARIFVTRLSHGSSSLG